MRRKGGAGAGSIDRDKDGRWRGNVHLGYRAGKRIRKAVSGKTRAEVALMRGPFDSPRSARPLGISWPRGLPLSPPLGPARKPSAPT